MGKVTAFKSFSPGLRKRRVGYIAVHTISRSCTRALNWLGGDRTHDIVGLRLAVSIGVWYGIVNVIVEPEKMYTYNDDKI